MVGEARRLELKEILTEKQIHHILKQAIGEDVPCKLNGSEVRPAADGIAGFLGDHMKATLFVDVEGEENKVHLFFKCLPTYNKPKADFIDEFNYFKRERLMFKVLEDICKVDENPWSVKAYVYTDTIIVMPDLSVEGYSSPYFLNTMDLEHVLVATTSIARFHGAYLDYETQKSIELKRPHNITDEFGEILAEPTFFDSKWMRTCAKLSKNLIKRFSTKSYRNLLDLESILIQRYIDTCASLVEYKDSINVLIHKDLWVNNIMFKYEENCPIGAILVDYQCLRYAPPAFDIMIFLYLTTDRQFRLEHEKDIFDHYYSTFVKYLSEDSKIRLNIVGYDKSNFVQLCEKGRMFGMLEAICIYPYTLMDPITAQATFDDPETYEKYLNEDRSEPVIAHADRCEIYKRRNLEVIEEFIETYVVK